MCGKCRQLLCHHCDFGSCSNAVSSKFLLFGDRSITASTLSFGLRHQGFARSSKLHLPTRLRRRVHSRHSRLPLVSSELLLPRWLPNECMPGLVDKPAVEHLLPGVLLPERHRPGRGRLRYQLRRCPRILLRPAAVRVVRQFGARLGSMPGRQLLPRRPWREHVRLPRRIRLPRLIFRPDPPHFCRVHPFLSLSPSSSHSLPSWTSR